MQSHEKTSQTTDDSNFIEREVSPESAKNDNDLALSALIMWASECFKRGVKIAGSIPGTFKLTPKGGKKDRHMVCSGTLGENGPTIGVRVRVTDGT